MVLPEFKNLVSFKPKTPLSLYEFYYLKLAESIHLTPIISISHPASSKIYLEFLLSLDSVINCNLNSII
mgnify:CR=1 FL=1